MAGLSYCGVLLLIVGGSVWLELALRTRVLVRWRRFLLTVIPVVVVMFAWDGYAIAHGHWTFSPTQTLGWLLPWHVPVEELLFFVVVPFASILTLEGVRSVTGWRLGDEPAERGSMDASR
jgi:lycopene cyclase domain-containing protein